MTNAESPGTLFVDEAVPCQYPFDAVLTTDEINVGI